MHMRSSIDGHMTRANLLMYIWTGDLLCFLFTSILPALDKFPNTAIRLREIMQTSKYILRDVKVILMKIIKRLELQKQTFILYMSGLSSVIEFRLVNNFAK